MSMKIVKALGLLLVCNLANAMDGVFDRSAEIDQYIAQLNGTATQAELITASRAIYISGISDERLAKAITERLLRDLPHLTSLGDGDQYGVWMVKALASTGDPSAKATIAKVERSTSVYRIKAELVVMSHYAKMLGYSNNPDYKPLLRKLLSAPRIVEKQARISIDRL